MRNNSTQDNTTKKSPFVILMDKVTQSEQETFELGRQLAKHQSAGSLVALFGELGSGKTRFIQGVCNGLEVKQNVTSPSFTLINEYLGRFKVFHFDLYRVSSLEEVMAFGGDEYFNGDGVCLIEWADRIREILPAERFEVYLEHRFENGNKDLRHIHIRHVKRISN